MFVILFMYYHAVFALNGWQSNVHYMIYVEGQYTNEVVEQEDKIQGRNFRLTQSKSRAQKSKQKS